MKMMIKTLLATTTLTQFASFPPIATNDILQRDISALIAGCETIGPNDSEEKAKCFENGTFVIQQRAPLKKIIQSSCTVSATALFYEGYSKCVNNIRKVVHNPELDQLARTCSRASNIESCLTAGVIDLHDSEKEPVTDTPFRILNSACDSLKSSSKSKCYLAGLQAISASQEAEEIILAACSKITNQPPSFQKTKCFTEALALAVQTHPELGEIQNCDKGSFNESFLGALNGALNGAFNQSCHEEQLKKFTKANKARAPKTAPNLVPDLSNDHPDCGTR
jgi:hypothetical protein